MPKRVFLAYAPPPRPDCVLKRQRGIRPLLTLGSSARQAPLAGAAVMFVGTTLDTFVQKYMARDTKKKRDLTRRLVGHHRWLYRRALPISYPNGNSGRQANSPNMPLHRSPLDSAVKALELPWSAPRAFSRSGCGD